MKRKALTIWLAAAWCLIALAALGGATYAWFTFQPYTNVEPISSTVSGGEVALLISNTPDGGFGTECVLPKSNGNLNPLSTSDLKHFYRAILQNRDGISTGYEDASKQVDKDTIHGVFYLQSLNNNCDVYFYRSGMNFGQDKQMLAASRLGLKITTQGGVQTYIFSLNEMGSTSGAEAKQTTAQKNVVVSGLKSGTTPNYVTDPAKAMSGYMAVPPADAGGRPGAGSQALCRIGADEVVTVEYWLYLEGCDENCINAVQNRSAGMQLSFAGVQAPVETQAQ